MTPAKDFDALILDMDGVLLDTRRSFTLATLLSARACADRPGLGEEWTTVEVERLRLAGGFNNDWDAAAALCLLGPLSRPGPTWNELCEELSRRGGGPDAVRTLAGVECWERARREVEPVFQRLYAGPRAFELYGLEPSERRGLHEEEVPLATPAELLEAGLPFGIFTGRTREEAGLGLDRLGLVLPPERLVCDSEPRFRKPGPDGLLVLAEALGARRPLHVGDTVDDLGSARAARAAGLAVRFAGVAPDGGEAERRLRAEGADAVRPSLRDVLIWMKEEEP